jgi:hypothetical protein
MDTSFKAETCFARIPVQNANSQSPHRKGTVEVLSFDRRAKSSKSCQLIFVISISQARFIPFVFEGLDQKLLLCGRAPRSPCGFLSCKALIQCTRTSTLAVHRYPGQH